MGGGGEGRLTYPCCVVGGCQLCRPWGYRSRSSWHFVCQVVAVTLLDLATAWNTTRNNASLVQQEYTINSVAPLRSAEWGPAKVETLTTGCGSFQTWWCAVWTRACPGESLGALLAAGAELMLEEEREEKSCVGWAACKERWVCGPEYCSC